MATGDHLVRSGTTVPPRRGSGIARRRAGNGSRRRLGATPTAPGSRTSNGRIGRRSPPGRVRSRPSLLRAGGFC
ncbi:MAG: hypothetical protein AVDCRST_MAG19-4653 [uncultured Thermomicrobiales bacterium]|uniref:Uncharacterized protein n=1 Tax=uncultured Thermomicrobiales bacterium TaxID=1645740 RepID=A0A6J4VVA4_9BACT|nr:MAG: hypothetical protein AVDCRST_MAG19-4653 [uncultured Thermomicrobiales bacterium]